MSDIHVDTTSSQVFLQFLCLYARVHLQCHILTNEHDPHHCGIVMVAEQWVLGDTTRQCVLRDTRGSCHRDEWQ